MLITTKENIKKLLGINADDIIIQSMALAASAAIEKYLDRKLEKLARTEYFDVDAGQCVFFVSAYPIVSIQVYNDADRAFATALSQTDYTYLGDSGRVVVDKYSLDSGYNALKVVYTGGLATSQAELEQNHPDLEMAARIQAALWFKSKDKLNVSSELIQNGGSVQYKKLNLDEGVKLMLTPYRNTRYV